jgi:hypothetical protein
MKNIRITFFATFMVLLLSTLTTLNGGTVLSPILGKWKLHHIRTDAKNITPKGDYYLEITESKVTFNKDVNTCQTDKFKLDANSISISNECTKKCCDGKVEGWAKDLHYSGKYRFEEKYLVIENEFVLFLTRQ